MKSDADDAGLIFSNLLISSRYSAETSPVILGHTTPNVNGPMLISVDSAIALEILSMIHTGSRIKKNTEKLFIPLNLALSPTGHLYLQQQADQEGFPSQEANKVRAFFSEGYAIGLLRLGLTNFNFSLPADFAFWQSFSQIFIAQACQLSNLDSKSRSSKLALPTEEVSTLIDRVPFMRGGEYLNEEVFHQLFEDLNHALETELIPFDGNLANYLASHHAAWNTVGRICFHLAENKNNPQKPFAFLATYTTRLSADASPQHLPLGRALQEYGGNSKKSLLLALLLPVQKAAEQSDFLKNLVDTGAIFQPLAWGAREAYQFLQDISLFEAAGAMVRVPNWWSPKRPPRPTVKVAIGNADSSNVGLDALLDFTMQFALPDGEQLTPDEMKALLSSQNALVQIKGQWVEVNRDKLSEVLAHWQSIEQDVKRKGLSFAEGLRLLAGVSSSKMSGSLPESVAEWSSVVEGPWLNKTLAQLRQPDQLGENPLKKVLQQHLNAELRPYQQAGVCWLWWLYKLRLGGCLADDMGLGKTIQVLSLLLLAKHEPTLKQKKVPHLLVLPASLLNNWQAEIARFAPSLTIGIAHSSAVAKEKSFLEDPKNFSEMDIVMTTYAYVHRLPWLRQFTWGMVILDEAQAIKNPEAKQTRAIKALSADVRFALTGTPVENHLLDLWSLFDFVAPGLLGSSRAFVDYSKQKSRSNREENHKETFYTAVRHLVKPYILRRLKRDKRIIADLPDKTELQTYCHLTKQQVTLYQQAVNDLTRKLEKKTDGMQRRGLVLSYLTRFKQICNHPNQWLGHGEYDSLASGKFLRLKELCEVIADKQEKVLVFTQFREIIPALSDFLAHLFGQPGLSLHGQTPIKERGKRVETFQKEEGPPFFVLSLKAGGTGLNLTAASHVIHFDRWWNPAVENQATDRAYRIGQQKNVLVHKFICLGTIEEKIDALITSKKTLAEEVVGHGGEAVLTELSDAELLKVVTLDIHRALGENA